MWLGEVRDVLVASDGVNTGGWKSPWRPSGRECLREVWWWFRIIFGHFQPGNLFFSHKKITVNTKAWVNSPCLSLPTNCCMPTKTHACSVQSVGFVNRHMYLWQVNTTASGALGLLVSLLSATPFSSDFLCNSVDGHGQIVIRNRRGLGAYGWRFFHHFIVAFPISASFSCYSGNDQGSWLMDLSHLPRSSCLFTFALCS